MSDVEGYRYNAPKGPNSRTHTYKNQRPCKWGTNCTRGDCYFVHPSRKEGSATRESDHGRSNAPHGYDAYRPGGPLKPLNTNINHPSGPKTTSTTPIEPRKQPQGPQDNGSKDRPHERLVTKSPTSASRNADRPSISQRKNTADTSKKAGDNDTTATIPIVDRMDVDLPGAGHPEQQSEHEEEVQTNDLTSESVVMTTDEVQQAMVAYKQTKASEVVDENETHLPTQKQLIPDASSNSDPRSRLSNSSEDLNSEAMSFGEALSAVIKLRIQISELETRRRHTKNDLLIYKKAIEKEQHVGKGSGWQESYETEKKALQQLDKEYLELHRRLNRELAKIEAPTLVPSSDTASTTWQGRENEALRRENESLREKLEGHSKLLEALQTQLQKMQSSQLMTKAGAVKAAEPIVFRLDRLEGIVKKTVSSRLEEEADHDNAALDQHETNINVQRELTGLKGELAGVSEQLSTLTDQHTRASEFSVSTDVKVRDQIKQFNDFTTHALGRIQHLERFVQKGSVAGNNTGTLVATNAERAVAGPSRSATGHDVGQRISALDVQLVSLRQRLDTYTMDQHAKLIFDSMQKVWNPHGGAIKQRLDAVEKNAENFIQQIRDWTTATNANVDTKAEKLELMRFQHTLTEALTTATANRRLVEELSKSLADDRAKDQDTRRDIDAINDSLAGAGASQDESNAEFEKFKSNFFSALEQQTKNDDTRDQNINKNAQDVVNLLSRLEELEEKVKSRADAKSRNDIQPRPDIMSIDSDETNRSSTSPMISKTPHRLGSSILQTPKIPMKRKHTEGSEQKHRNGRHH